MNSQINEFIDYVLSFYGPGGIYDMGMTRDEALMGTGIRIGHSKFNGVHFEGDSIDREAVRDIVDLGEGR